MRSIDLTQPHDQRFCPTLQSSGELLSSSRASKPRKGGFGDAGTLGQNGELPIAPIIEISCERQLSEEFASIAEQLDPNIEWTQRVNAMLRLEGLVKGGAAASPLFVELLPSMQIPLNDQLQDRRSAISRQACHLICTLIQACGSRSETLAGPLLPAVFKAQGMSIQVVTEASDACCRTIMHYCPSTRHLSFLCPIVKTHKSVKMRLAAAEYLSVAIREWDPSLLDRQAQLVEQSIMSASQDAAAETREIGRSAFVAYWALRPAAAQQMLKRLPDTERSLRDKLQKQVQMTLGSEAMRTSDAVVRVSVVRHSATAAAGPSSLTRKGSAGGSSTTTSTTYTNTTVSMSPCPSPSSKPPSLQQKVGGASAARVPRLTLPSPRQQAIGPITTSATSGYLSARSTGGGMTSPGLPPRPSAAVATASSPSSKYQRVMDGSGSLSSRSVSSSNRMPRASLGGAALRVAQSASRPAGAASAGGGGTMMASSSPDRHRIINTGGGMIMPPHSTTTTSTKRAATPSPTKQQQQGYDVYSNALPPSTTTTAVARRVLRQPSPSPPTITEATVAAARVIIQEPERKTRTLTEVIESFASPAASKLSWDAKIELFMDMQRTLDEEKTPLQSLSATATASTTTSADASEEQHEEASAKLINILIEGIGDSHFKVCAAALEALTTALGCPLLTPAFEVHVEALSPILFARMTDAKETIRHLAGIAADMLPQILPIDAVLHGLAMALNATKAPKVMCAVMDFFNETITIMAQGQGRDPADSGAVRGMLVACLPLATHKHPDVRQSALGAVSAMYYSGENSAHAVKGMIEVMPPAAADAIKRGIAQIGGGPGVVAALKQRRNLSLGASGSASGYSPSRNTPRTMAMNADLNEEVADLDDGQHLKSFQLSPEAIRQAALTSPSPSPVKEAIIRRQSMDYTYSPTTHEEEHEDAGVEVEVDRVRVMPLPSPTRRVLSPVARSSSTATETTTSSGTKDSPKEHPLHPTVDITVDATFNVQCTTPPLPPTVDDAIGEITEGTRRLSVANAGVGMGVGVGWAGRKSPTPSRKPSNQTPRASPRHASSSNPPPSPQPPGVVYGTHDLEAVLAGLHPIPTVDSMSEALNLAPQLDKRELSVLCSGVQSGLLSALTNGASQDVVEISMRTFAELAALMDTRELENMGQALLKPLLLVHGHESEGAAFMAEKAATQLIGALPPVSALSLLVPMLPRTDKRPPFDGERAVQSLAVLRLLKVLLPSLSPPQVSGALPSMVPSMCVCYTSANADLRRAAVDCLVALNLRIGEVALAPHTQLLSTAQLKLIEIYVERAKKNPHHTAVSHAITTF